MKRIVATVLTVLTVALLVSMWVVGRQDPPAPDYSITGDCVALAGLMEAMESTDTRMFCENGEVMIGSR